MKFIKKFESIQNDPKVSDIIFDLESIFGDLDLEFDLGKNPINSSGGIYKNEGFTLSIKIEGKYNNQIDLCSRVEECVLKSTSILSLEFSFCLIYYKYESPITCNKLQDLRSYITNRQSFDSKYLDEIVIFFHTS